MRSDNVTKGSERGPQPKLFTHWLHPEGRPADRRWSALQWRDRARPPNLDKIADAPSYTVWRWRAALHPDRHRCLRHAPWAMWARSTFRLSRDDSRQRVETMLMHHQLPGLVLVPTGDKDRARYHGRGPAWMCSRWFAGFRRGSHAGRQLGGGEEVSLQDVRGRALARPAHHRRAAGRSESATAAPAAVKLPGGVHANSMNARARPSHIALPGNGRQPPAVPLQ